MNASPSFLLLAAWNVEVMAGTLAAILGHWANLGKQPHNRTVERQLEALNTLEPMQPRAAHLIQAFFYRREKQTLICASLRMLVSITGDQT